MPGGACLAATSSAVRWGDTAAAEVVVVEDSGCLVLVVGMTSRSVVSERFLRLSSMAANTTCCGARLPLRQHPFFSSTTAVVEAAAASFLQPPWSWWLVLVVVGWSFLESPVLVVAGGTLTAGWLDLFSLLCLTDGAVVVATLGKRGLLGW